MTNRLSRFVLLSVFVHGLVLAMLAGGARDDPGRLPGQAWLPVSLEQPLAATGRRAPAGEKPPHTLATKAATPTTASAPVEETATAANDAGASPQIEAAGQSLQAALHRALLPYFYYPLLARSQGWHGEAQFAVHVAANGHLSQLRLMRSSGYAVLDRAALDSLGKIRELPEALHHDLGAPGMTLRIPVVYKLTEG